MVVSIRELTNVSNISQESSWEKILAKYDEINDSEVTLDTEGVYMMAPTDSESFKKLIRRDNLKKIILRNEHDLAVELRLYCIMEDLKLEVDNIEIEVKEKEKIDTSIANIGNEIRDKLVTIDGDKAYIDVYSRYKNIGDTKVIDRVMHAVDRIINEDNIKDITIQLEDCAVEDFVVKSIVRSVVEYKNRDIELKVDSDNEGVINKFTMYMHSNLSNYTDAEREEFIRENLKDGDAGLLIKYKKSRATDDFGREGKGEIVQARVAIYKGIIEENGEKFIVIDSYDKNTFFPSSHWEATHDGESTVLKKNRIKMRINELGVYEQFIGRKYHFSKPIQYDIKDREEIVIGYSNDGKVYKKMCTIPELMMETFDDRGIYYNTELLKEAIEETKEVLGL